jgi:hypothetical protein
VEPLIRYSSQYPTDFYEHNISGIPQNFFEQLQPETKEQKAVYKHVTFDG